MNPTILGVLGPGFLNQVPTLPKEGCWSSTLLPSIRDSPNKAQEQKGHGSYIVGASLAALQKIDVDLMRLMDTILD